jgi:hypothetical protein
MRRSRTEISTERDREALANLPDRAAANFGSDVVQGSELIVFTPAAPVRKLLYVPECLLL